MKKLLKFLFVTASISIVSTANASDPLIDSVVKVFKSNTSTIKYDITAVTNSIMPSSVKRSAKQTINYLLKNGNTELHVAEFSNNGKLYLTSCELYLDGFFYRFGISGDISIMVPEHWPSIVGRAVKVSDEEVIAAAKAESEMMREKYKMSDDLVKLNSPVTGSLHEEMMKGLKYYFLPLMPEENKIIADGVETLQNFCVEYSASGSQLIQGKNLQFIEYKTPTNFPFAMTARYYFDNGRLAKYVHIIKNGEIEISPELKSTCGDNFITNMGGYTIINIHEFTTDVNDNFLTLPENIKIIENTKKRGR